MSASDVYLVLVNVLSIQTAKWIISTLVQEEINLGMYSNYTRIAP